VTSINNHPRNGPYEPIHQEARLFGSLSAITDSERNALRSITLSALESATRTSDLLATLLAVPGLLIFQGVIGAAVGIPLVPHIICAGRIVVLVESVAWPPGTYHAGENGQVYCDGVYIGQSVRPLLTAVAYWRDALPPGHGVSALVIVHQTADGCLTLPTTGASEVTWVSSHEAIQTAKARLSAQRRRVSPETIEKLYRSIGD
jgi:hypothetical protein